MVEENNAPAGSVASETGRLLDRDALGALGADRKTEKVVVNDKGDYVFVTELSGSDREWLEKQTIRMEGGRQVQDPEGAIAKMLVLGLTDEKQQKLFGRNEWQKVRNWKSSLMQRIFDAICDISGISEKARESFLSDSKRISLDD